MLYAANPRAIGFFGSATDRAHTESIYSSRPELNEKISPIRDRGLRFRRLSRFALEMTYQHRRIRPGYASSVSQAITYGFYLLAMFPDRQEAVDMLCDLAVRKLSPGTSSGSSCKQQSPGASCNSPRRLRRLATRTPTAETDQGTMKKSHELVGVYVGKS